MARLELTEHLTDGHSDELSSQLRQTHEGMAHFAGTGPDGKRCQHCAHWGLPHERKAAGGVFDAKKPRSCAEYVRLKRMQGVKKRAWEKIPESAAACKYFTHTVELGP